MSGTNRTSSSHKFSEIPKAEIQRSTFDRSSGLKTAFNASDIVPIFVDEALPGDTFNLRMHTFARLATPLHPILDNMYLESFFFAVPMRLVWENWEKFNGQQTNPGDSTSFEIPQMTTPPNAPSQDANLSDYLGIPFSTLESFTHSSLFHRAYNLIWNEWFRDENLQDSVVVDLDDGPDDPADYSLLKRGKRHDYFTSGLPWPQKGDSVLLPLGTSAPVAITPDTDTGIPTFDYGNQVNKSLRGTAGTSATEWTGSASGTTPSASWNDPQLVGLADLTQATAATINELRQAFQIQRLYERDARGGSRYTEIIRSHFGVTSPDQRLQRPEYLGGGQQSITITPVQATNQSGNVDLGQLGGVGVSAGSNHTFTKSFTEHCIILGFVNVRADLTYQQGLPRMFSRLTRWDFFWPALSMIGEQEIKNKEIFAQGTGDLVTDEETFAFQERFAEYRYAPSRTSGIMRSSRLDSLDTWHLAQEFSSLPTLGSDFIEDNAPVDRITIVTTQPNFLFDAHFELKCARPMPTFGVPGMIDHF